MKGPFKVPEEIARRQDIAADPRNSAWVSANAGSGKTHVLSRRVIRLLLRGTDPSKILCLTYTRAAAANMASRVYDDLAAWTVLAEAELAEEIGKLEGARPDAEKLGRARRLFAEALETPGGLKIQTIHAFCEAVLHQFPLEANIAGHFEMLDQQMERALIAEASRAMITGAAVADNPGLAAAFAKILDESGESGLGNLLGEVVAKRDGLRAFIRQAETGAGEFPLIFEEFGFASGETADSIAASVWPLSGFNQAGFDEFAHAAHAVAAKTIIDDLLPAAIAAFAEIQPQRRLKLLAKGFLKLDGEPYSDSNFKQALRVRLPDILERYAEAAAAIKAAADRLALFRMLEATSAALVVADWLIARYERMKAGRGFLDFNDLITRTVRLLSRPDVGAWVQYKLDQGIDHILLDEAQDTSPDQWDVVRQLAGDFFSGLGARDGVHRTIFAVGDEKQSIYSFQGADPRLFADSERFFGKHVRDGDGRFETVKLTWSFRSTDDVLGAVDLVFAGEQVRKGLTRDPEPIEHKAIRAGAPGYVEVWPSVGAAAVEEPDDWKESVDHATAPAVQLANAIAKTISGWIRDREPIEGKGRALGAGDVLVLVRKRDRFIHALSRRLKVLGIAVAGADRLSLSGHIAVKDLVALGRVVLQPHDDLSLAALLKSPIFGLPEDRLFDIAHGRGPAISLHRALAAKAPGDPLLSAIADQLDRWSSEAAFKPVFDFYAGVLGRDGARRKLVLRLGPEAGDILDEFLNFCLAQESTGTPGLEAFLATLESAAPEVKREMDQSRAEIRIMTAHAAKGLEAPVVILVDNGSRPFSEQHLPRLLPFASQKNLWQGNGFFWRASKDIANASSRAAAARIKQAAEEEYRRLLYVGMTRAEDRLIVCGYHGQQQPDAGTWHALVSAALAGAPESEALPDPAFGGMRHRYRLTRPRPAQLALDFGAAPAKASLKPAPQWLRQPLPPEPVLPKPLTPSRATASIDAAAERVAAARSPVLDADAEPSFAIARGLALHRMLQVLPGLPVSQRHTAARRYVERAGRSWPPDEHAGAVGAVMRILEEPGFAAIFSESSRAEVGIAGTLEIGGVRRAISGKIDRLAVTGDAVLIVDYKTNRPPPSRLDEVPQAYVAQLALYRALLEPLYPGRLVSAALLFTEAPLLIAVPAAALDHALVRLTRP